MELDLSGAPCLVFQHGSCGRVNIIYRRADGNVGWIDPPGAKSGRWRQGRNRAASGTRPVPLSALTMTGAKPHAGVGTGIALE